MGFCCNLIISQKSYNSIRKLLDKLPQIPYNVGNLTSYRQKKGCESLIDVDKLRGRIAEKGLSQTKVAKEIGIAPKTFYEKMSKGVFGSDEIETMIECLDIENPMDYFFVQKK